MAWVEFQHVVSQLDLRNRDQTEEAFEALRGEHWLGKQCSDDQRVTDQSRLGGRALTGIGNEAKRISGT